MRKVNFLALGIMIIALLVVAAMLWQNSQLSAERDYYKTIFIQTCSMTNQLVDLANQQTRLINSYDASANLTEIHNKIGCAELII